MITAEQIMSSRVITIHPHATLQEAIHLVLEHRVSGLPVVDDDQRLIGIITEFALLALAYDQELRQQAVEQHMTRDVLTVNAADGVNQLADLFIVHRVRRVPVLSDGRLVGLVSRRDVLATLEGQQAPVCTA